MECVQEPGELLFIPSGWWWSNVNIDDSIAMQVCQRYNDPGKLITLSSKLKHASDNAASSGCWARRETINYQATCWWKMAMSKRLIAPLIGYVIEKISSYHQRPKANSFENFIKGLILSYFKKRLCLARWGQPKRRHKLLKAKTSGKATESRRKKAIVELRNSVKPNFWKTHVSARGWYM